MASLREEPSRKLLVSSDQRLTLNTATANSTLGWTREKAREKTERNLKALEDFQYHLYADGSKSLLIVLQGIDAAGKDGLVRKVFTAFNPQGTHVSSFKVPAGREVKQDFLWRVHAACPPKGSVGIFNRSHYEDVIVPIMNDSLSRKGIDARISHINGFERMLHDEGTTIVKFLLHISKEEQWERLMARLDEPERNWKFSVSDLAERKRWDKYMTTFSKVVKSTSTDYAPWYVIPANAKWFRDFAVSEILCGVFGNMALRWPNSTYDIESARKELKALR
jgi:PPK2 family polyphosphate:nucleotide phosphotransferase